MDPSHNNLGSTLPRCLDNFTAMAQKQSYNVSISHVYEAYSEAFSLNTYGSAYSFYIDNTLVVFKEKYINSKTTKVH